MEVHLYHSPNSDEVHLYLFKLTAATPHHRLVDLLPNPPESRGQGGPLLQEGHRPVGELQVWQLQHLSGGSQLGQ